MELIAGGQMPERRLEFGEDDEDDENKIIELYFVPFSRKASKVFFCGPERKPHGRLGGGHT